MSIKLPFKPIFALEYDDELLVTIKQQVSTNSKIVQDAVVIHSELIPLDIKESLDFLTENSISFDFFIAICLNLYYLERKFVKATELCLKNLMENNSSSDKINVLFTLVENWPSEKLPLLSVYKLKKETEEQRIIQLTDKAFKWIDSFIALTKKHEYELFDDAFHKQGFFSNEESILNELGLKSKKRVLIQDNSNLVTEFENKLLENLKNSKLSVIISDLNFELKQFLNFFILKLLNLHKKVLWNRLDFFKQQFSEFFTLLDIVYITTIDDKQFPDQYEVVSSLRETPSIIIVSEESWLQFEQMKVFIHGIRTLTYPKMDLADNIHKEYVEKFWTKYIDTIELSFTSTEKIDLKEAVFEKSAGSITYIDNILTYIKTLKLESISNSVLKELPQNSIELLATEFKRDFFESDTDKNILKTLLGLSTIQKSFSITYFTKKQIFEFYKIVLKNSGNENKIEDKNTDKLLNFFTKIGSLYTFTSNILVNALFNSNKIFNDEKTENFAFKKLFLVIQNTITDLTEFKFVDRYKEVLIGLLQSADSLDIFLSFLDLIIIDPEFMTLIKNSNFDKDHFFKILEETKRNESNLLKKPFIETINYVLYTLEYLFDGYIVKGLYETSKAILEYLEISYDLIENENKPRFFFQKARQTIAKGDIERTYNNLTQGIKLAKQTKNYWTLGILLRLVAETYFINKQPVFGNYSFDQIFQLYQRIVPDKTRFKAYTLLKLSDRLNEIGLFAYSLQSIEESAEIFHTKSLLLEEVNTKQKMADILFKLGSTDLAVNELTLALTLIRDLDDSLTKRLEAIKNAFVNSEIYHPLYAFKNWTKVNYFNAQSLELQLEKYQKIFLEIREKDLSEDSLQQMIIYLRLLFKSGKILEFRLVLDYIERHIPAKSLNRGLLYLELSLIHNFFANADIANYYSDLAKNTLFSLPIDYEISIKYQLNYISFQLYNNKYELAELLLQDQFLRRKGKNEADLYLLLANLESHKNLPNNFEAFFEKGKSLKLEKSESPPSKQDIRLYGSGLLYNQYIKLFPLIDMPKKDIELIEEINWHFYTITIDVNTSNYSLALQKFAKIDELAKGLTTKTWQDDFTIIQMKKLGQIYYNDKSNPENIKKSIYYWQNALKKISEIITDNPLLYLFERLDLLYLIGKSAVINGLFDLDEANKYLISGKNLIKKHKVHNSLQLEFQFDSALAANYFEAKNYEKAIKYYNRALDKHNNKLYAELQTILTNLSLSYIEQKETEELESFIKKYKEYFKIFGIQEELISKGIEKNLLD